jgi:hypothetical protein
MQTSRQDALGRMIDIWSYCTEKKTYYLTKEIIDELAEFEGFAELLCETNVELAELKAEGVYRIRGTKGRIEWKVKLEKNSQKGGAKTKAKWEAKRGLKEGQLASHLAVPNEGPLSPAPVPALALSKIQNLKAPTPSGAVALAGSDFPEDNPVGKFIAAYVKAYQARYDGARPELVGKVQGQIKNFLKQTPLQRACDLIQVYCQMNDRWFETKMHDFTTFLENLNKVSYALKHGTEAQAGAHIDWSKITLEGA